MEEEQKETEQELEEEKVETGGEVEEEVKEEADRPEKNYKAELDRKNKEIDRLRQEADVARQSAPTRRDPADITTWSDNELKAIVSSNDPSVLAYKEQASDTLLERKVKSIRERERVQEKRTLADLELKSKFPEASDPSSPLAIRMEQVLYDYDLQKSPAGRLAAAKIADAELRKGKAKMTALDRNSESNRVRDVKAQMVDGDRPKPTGLENPKKHEELEKRIRKGDSDAVGELLKTKGISQASFFKK